MKKIGLFLLALPIVLAGCAKQDDTSIGIIGGADWPTAIFILGKFKWLIIALGIIVVLAISLVVYFLKKKK